MPLTREVYLIQNLSQFYELEKQGVKKNYVTDVYSTYIENPDKIDYLYHNVSQSSQRLEFVHNASLNWYKNEFGEDVIQRNGISIGPIIAKNVAASFANDYRNYLAIKKTLDKCNTIYIDKHAPISFYRVSKVFKHQIKWFDAANRLSDNTSSPIRAQINHYPKIHKLSFFARLLQKPIKFFIKNKIIIFSDWTYGDVFLKHKKCLSFNRINLLQGCYLKYNESSFEYSESKYIFPDTLPKGVIDIRNMVKHKEWDDNLVCLFESTLQRVYSDSRLKLRRAYAIYKELFSYYKPDSVIFPTETYFAHLIALQIAKTMHIKTILALDGYPFLKNTSGTFPLHRSNKSTFDYYIAFGEYVRKLYRKYEYILDRQILVYQSPLVRKIKQREVESSLIIIMAFYPNVSNPDARWDKRFSITLDVVDLMVKMGEKQIVIKVKNGFSIELDMLMYEKYLNKLTYGPEVNIKVVAGEFPEIVHKAKMVVGQISTALFESIVSRVPYFIYEPYDAGRIDLYFDEYHYNTARDIRQLKNNISAKNFNSPYVREFFMNGCDLEEFKLEKELL
jgi:hypothetical protein